MLEPGTSRSATLPRRDVIERAGPAIQQRAAPAMCAAQRFDQRVVLVRALFHGRGRGLDHLLRAPAAETNPDTRDDAVGGDVDDHASATGVSYSRA